MTTDIKNETAQRVGAVAPWLGTYAGVMFASALRKMKAKLRKGYRHTIDTSDKEATEWPTYDHPVIEVKQGAQWILLKMPDGTTFFKTAEEIGRASCRERVCYSV
jgi:hypothetical protein